MGSFLRLDHVNFNYHGLEGETLALANVSFEIEEGEFAAIVGPSGCGKTTLLSLIAGLEQPDMVFSRQQGARWLYAAKRSAFGMAYDLA